MSLCRLLAILVLVLLTAGGCVPLPAALPAPGATGGTEQAVAEPVNLNRAPAGRLEASRVSAAPRLDGRMDAVWATARPLRIPLAAPSHGSGPQGAREIELRAVHTADTLYLLARWPGEPPPDDRGYDVQSAYHPLDHTHPGRVPRTRLWGGLPHGLRGRARPGGVHELRNDSAGRAGCAVGRRRLGRGGVVSGMEPSLGERQRVRCPVR